MIKRLAMYTLEDMPSLLVSQPPTGLSLLVTTTFTLPSLRLPRSGPLAITTLGFFQDSSSCDSNGSYPRSFPTGSSFSSRTAEASTSSHSFAQGSSRVVIHTVDVKPIAEKKSEIDPGFFITTPIRTTWETAIHP